MYNTPSFNLRQITDADLSFLAKLYASTRAAEMAAVPWPEFQKQAFLFSQFQLQHQHYQQQFPAAEFFIIDIAGQPVGRIYYCWEAETMRLIDIALLPEFKRKRIASQLMAKLMRQVQERGGRLFLHVDITNPAREWYLRLGFVPVDPRAELINGVYQQLHWLPAE